MRHRPSGRAVIIALMRADNKPPVELVVGNLAFYVKYFHAESRIGIPGQAAGIHHPAFVMGFHPGNFYSKIVYRINVLFGGFLDD